jgi:hypothetical protein
MSSRSGKVLSMIRTRDLTRVLDAASSARALPAWVVTVLGGLALLDGLHESESLTFVGLLLLLLLAGLAVTLGARIRDAALPITEALAAAGGALLAIAFSLGFTDERYMKAASTGQLMLAVLSVTVALVSARLRIAREGRARERLMHERITRIEQTQMAILRRSAAARRRAATSRNNVTPTRTGRQTQRRR